MNTDKYDEMAREMYSSLDFLEPFTHKARDEKFIYQIASALRQVERETLERAAKVCEDMAGDAGNWSIRYRCAQAIRALNVSTDNELSTTPELADVSTPVKLIDQWQPIETAPKNGTWVLSINAETNPGRQHVVHYSTRHGEKFPWVTDAAPMSWVAGLTHWMPLPAAPIQAAEKGE